MEPSGKGRRGGLLWALLLTVCAAVMVGRGWCVVCGKDTASKDAFSLLSPCDQRPAYCNGSGDCCTYMVNGKNPQALHLDGRFYDNEQLCPLKLTMPPESWKRGIRICSVCAVANRAAHKELQRAQLPTPPPTTMQAGSRGPLTTSTVVNTLLAIDALSVGAATFNASTNTTHGLSNRTRAHESSVGGVDAPLSAAPQPAPAVAALPPGPASPSPPSPPPPPPPNLNDPITTAPPASTNPLGHALPPLPSSVPPPVPPNPVQAAAAAPEQQAPPQPPQPRPPRHANFTTSFGTKAAPPTGAEVVFYAMLDVFFDNHCYHADDTRLPTARNQTVILGRMVPFFSHLTGVPCPESQVRDFLAAFRKGQRSELPAAYTDDSRKRCNVYARQIYDFSASDAGRLLTELLAEENPLEVYTALCDVAFPAAAIMEAAAAAAGTSGEYEILPEACRLADISDSFQPGRRAGCSQWDESVLANWACYEHTSSDGRRALRFVPRNSSAHDQNKLELQLHPNLTYSVFSCGEHASMPPDGPDLDRLLNQQALMEVLMFVYDCHPCAGGTSAAAYGPYLQYQRQKVDAGAQVVVALERYRDTPRRVHLPGPRAGGGTAAAQILDVHPSHSCYGLVSNKAFAARCSCCAAGVKSLHSALDDFDRQQARAEAKVAAAAQQEAAANASVAEQLQSVLGMYQRHQEHIAVVEAERSRLRIQNAELRQTIEQYKGELDASRVRMTRLPASDSSFLAAFLKNPDVQRAIKRYPGLTALWSDQLEYLRRAELGGKMVNGIEWHNAAIQLGLTLLNKGGKGLYEEIRSFLPLPCVNTLRDYKHFAADGPGFFRPQALRAAELIQAAGASKRVGLAFDEMKLSKGLTFALGSDTLAGFSDVDAGAWAQRLEGLMEARASPADAEGADHACRSLASHVLHFEVTALGQIPTRYSVGYVFTDGIKAAELKAIVAECILLVEAAGMEVAYTVCDGAAENRAWMELMADKEAALKAATDANITLPCPDDRVTECLRCFPSPANPKRPVIMLTDGPHLIKKGRNNWEKSGSGTGANGESTAMMLWPPNENATNPEERTRWRNLASSRALAAALTEAAAGKPCPAWVQYSSWLLNSTCGEVKGANGKLAALRPVVAAQYSPACASAWEWCICNLSIPEPKGWPLCLESGAQQSIVPANPSTDGRAAAIATFATLGPAACLVHSACFNTAYSLAVLDTLMLPDVQHGGTKVQKEERARHSKVYQLYSSASASERLLGWALHSAANAITASDPRHGFVQQLIAGREDGKHRRVFDEELLESLPQRQLAIPTAGLAGFFVRLHPTIIERFRSANMVLQDGSGAVRKLIDRIRYDRAAWLDFKGAVGLATEGSGGNGSEGNGGGSSSGGAGAGVSGDSKLSHVRSVMGVLVRKYIHASLAGLLRHTQLLAGKDEACKRSLREERRADAARKTSGGAKAVVVNAATRCVDCRRPHPADNMLMCDRCPGAYQAHCLGIPMPEPDSGDWYCPVCCPEAYGRTAVGGGTGAYADVEDVADGRGQRGGRGGSGGRGGRGRGRGQTAVAVDGGATGGRGRGRGRGGAACGRGRGDVVMEDVQVPAARSSARNAARPKRFNNSPAKAALKRTRP